MNDLAWLRPLTLTGGFIQKAILGGPSRYRNMANYKPIKKDGKCHRMATVPEGARHQ
jgi:hypothetical protein